MHPGNFQAAGGRLQEALEQLMAVWSRASEQWRDANSQHIEEHELHPIAEEVNAALPAISHLAAVIATARRECEETA